MLSIAVSFWIQIRWLSGYRILSSAAFPKLKLQKDFKCFEISICSYAVPLFPFWFTAYKDITKTRPCNILRYFTAVKMVNFR